MPWHGGTRHGLRNSTNMTRKELFIYGAGGLGREILSLVKTLSGWSVAGFIDDRVPAGTKVNGLEVLGGKDYLLTYNHETHLILALGDPRIKSEVAKSLENSAIIYPTLVHRAAVLQDNQLIKIGEGSIITAGCVLTTNIRIGKHVLINLNSTIGHDVHIGNYCSVMPGVNIAGEVIIGDCVLIGSGANILNRMVISEKSRVGMGAVVTKPVAPGATVVGVPAKPMNR